MNVNYWQLKNVSLNILSFPRKLIILTGLRLKRVEETEILIVFYHYNIDSREKNLNDGLAYYSSFLKIKWITSELHTLKKLNMDFDLNLCCFAIVK